MKYRNSADQPAQHPLEAAGGTSPGFVLPLALTALALMALSLWAAVASFELATRNVRDQRDALAFEIAATNIEARLMFVATTEPLGPAGFRMGGARISKSQMLGLEGLTETQTSRALPKYLRLDGRHYEAPSDLGETTGGNKPSMYVTLQDRSGMVNLNLPDEQVVTRALQLVGVDASTAPIMAAVLADYIDEDDLRRIDGAERDFYARMQQPPPLNMNLRIASQAFDAYGWRALSRNQQDSLLQFSFAGPRNLQKNVNTASHNTIQAWLGVDAATASRIVESRESDPFLSTDEISTRIGIAIPQDEYSIYTTIAPQFRIVISQTAPSCRTKEIWISLPEQASSRPLFFAGGQGMTCGSLDLESSRSDGFATPFPNSELLLSSGER